MFREVPDGCTQRLTPEFKLEAVQLLESGSRFASELPASWGYGAINSINGSGSSRPDTGAFPASGARKERTTEIIRLKRKLARVTEERDILRKAAAYVAKDVR